MKTRRNIRRNKTQNKGQKRRRTYKMRYGGVNFDPVEFLRVEKELREKQKQKELLNQLRIEANLENLEKI